MKKFIHKFIHILFISLTIVLVHASIANAKGIALAPVISGIAPIQQIEGGLVTITGYYFDANPSNNTVYFGPVKASVISGTDSTQLVVAVPAGATYGPLTLINTQRALSGQSSQYFSLIFPGGSINPAKFPLQSIALSVPNAQEIKIEDLDGDGLSEVIVLSDSGIQIFRNTSTASVVGLSVANELILSDDVFSSFTIADFDNDGKKDIAASGAQNELVIYQNTSTSPTISFTANYFTGSVYSLENLASADFDNDGYIDIIGSKYGGIYIHQNLQSFIFTSQVAIASLSGVNFVSVADLDKDGLMDIIVCDNSIFKFYRNVNNFFNYAAFSPTASIYPAYSGSVNSFKIADINYDGNLDVVYAYSSAPYTGLNAIKSNGIFSSSSDFTDTTLATPTNPSVTAIDINDFDGNGKLDIAIDDNSGYIDLYSDTTFTLTTITHNKNITEIHSSDLNGDGYPDFVGFEANNVVLYLNKTTTNNIPVIADFGNADTSSTLAGQKIANSACDNYGRNSDEVTITGSNFYAITSLLINGNAPSYTIVNDNLISFSMPDISYNSGQYSGKISVTNADGADTTVQVLQVTFCPYYNIEKPYLQSVTKGSYLQLSGSDMIGVTGAVLDSIAKVNIKPFFNTSSNALYVPIPDTSVLHDTISVKLIQGSITGFYLYDQFIIDSAQSIITSFAPASGVSGSLITVTGRNIYIGETSGYVGNNYGGEVYSINDTTYAFNVPYTSDNLSTTGPIIINNAMSQNYFIILPATIPTITGISPHSTYQGYPITINGFNLDYVDYLTFGPNQYYLSGGQFTYTSPTQIVFPAPVSYPQPMPVIVNKGSNISAITPDTDSLTVLDYTGSITGISISGTSFKSNDTIVVQYTTSGVFPPDATFNLIMSDQYGQFSLKLAAANVVIVESNGNLTPAATGSINAISSSATGAGTIYSYYSLTAPLVSGNQYKLLVSSDSYNYTYPVVSDTISNITINQIPFFRPDTIPFSPMAGSVNDQVTLSGFNFLDDSLSAIHFNGIDVTSYTVVDNNTIFATVPSDAVTGTISILYPGDSSTTKEIFTGLCSFVNSLSVAGNSFSPGENINIAFNSTSQSPDIFIAQLSGVNGDFSFPIPLGSTIAPVSGLQNINGLLLDSITIDSTYRIRILSTSVGCVSNDTANIKITYMPPSVTGITITGDSSYAGGDTATVDFSATYHFNQANTFTAELSNRFGQFNNATLPGINIGSVTGFYSGSIPVTFPAGIIAGYSYRIRVNATAPSSNSVDNGYDFAVFSAPTITGFSPLSGVTGSLITIKGFNFVSITGITLDTLKNATYTVVDPNTIIATVPAGAVTSFPNISGVYGSAIADSVFTVIYNVTLVTVTTPGNNFSITTSGGYLQLGAVVSPFNATDPAIIWAISDTTIATIDTIKGLVMSLTNGIVTVTATSLSNPTVSGIAVVSVSGQFVPVASVAVTAKGNNFFINLPGGTLQLNTSVLPANATDPTVTWLVSDTTIASVDTTGLITSLTNGIVTVTAISLSNPTVSGIAVVSVSGQFVPVTSVAVTAKGNNFFINLPGGTLQLNTSVLPANATDPTVAWLVSDTTIASVDTTGLITSLTNGIVTVTAISLSNPTVSGIAVVSVSGQFVPVTSVAVTAKGNNFLINLKGGTLQLNTAVLPANATDATVIWTVSDTTISSIDTTGLITAITDGIVTVTAISLSNPTVSGLAVISISGQFVQVTAVTVIPSNGIAPVISIIGSSLQLNTQILPVAATNPSVQWSVSDINIASIDSTGLLTAINNGLVTITALSLSNPTVSGMLTVTITNQFVAVSSMYISGQNNISLISYALPTLPINAVFTPSDATDQRYSIAILQSSQPNLAYIDTTNKTLKLNETSEANGVVTIIGISMSNPAITGIWVTTVIGKIGKATTTITGKPAPGSNQKSPCNGTLELSIDTGFVQYQWFLIQGIDTLKVIGANQANYTPVLFGSYFVRAVKSDSTLEYIPIAATISGVLKPGITGNGDPGNITELVADKNPTGLYRWYVNNKLIRNATQQSLQVWYNGFYFVSTTDKDSCKTVSDQYEVSNKDYISIGRAGLWETDSTIENYGPPSINDQFKVFPNPTSKDFTLEYESLSKSTIKLQVFSLMGILVSEEQLSYDGSITRTHTIKTDDLPKGIYYLKITDGSLSGTKKLILY